MATAPILWYLDPLLPFVLDTDASTASMEAVLSQGEGAEERVVAHYGSTFSPPEKNHSAETTGIDQGCLPFPPQSRCRPFRLQADHASLIWLCKQTEPSIQVARWLEILSKFSYTIEHWSGNKHPNADRLS